jgi:hypothetical protein
MTDTLDFVKNLWGNMGLPGVNMPGLNIPGMPGMSGGGLNIPGMVMPTLSVEEINKKISDLKAVESWLALNMSMLRGTIQALEVQVATISTLKSMGESFTNTINPAARSKPQEAPAAPTTNGSDSGTSSNGADSGSGPAPTRRTKSHAPEPTSKDEQDAATLTAPLVNAAAWWNMLQDQFKQAVGTAMTSESGEEKPSAEKKASKPKTAKAAGASSASGTTTRKRKTAK